MGIMRNFPKLNKINRNLKDSVSKINKNSTPLADGERGTIQTIEKLIEIAHKEKINPEIRNFAIKIINEAGVKDQNYLDEIRAIANYIHKNFRYIRDPKRNEFIITPLESIRKIESGNLRGDCEDMSLLGATLIASIGGTPYFTIVKYSEKAHGYQHIYLTVLERNRTKKKEKLVIDAIVKSKPIGYEVKSKIKKYFKV